MKGLIIEIEKIIDEKSKELSIFKLPFQSIYTALMFCAEHIDCKRDSDTAMDYLGRISLIYPLVKTNAIDARTVSSSEAITKVVSTEFSQDLDFLNAYAHFSMLMPQIHRGTLEVKSITDNKIKLDFPNDEVKISEVIDKIYTTISIPISLKYKVTDEILETIKFKIKSGDTSLSEKDIFHIQKIYLHHLKSTVNIEVINDKILESILGFTNLDFNQFVASLKAFSDYFLFISRTYESLIDKNNTEEENNLFANEHLEWSTCCLDYKVLGYFMSISQLSSEKFNLILSYFLDIYSNKTKEIIISNSVVGDGFQPPITLINESILFSALGLRYFLSFNNLLYSLNIKQKKIFDNKISSELEPVLINQLEKLFSPFKDLECKRNVNYSASEIDLMVLSKNEKVCLSIQVKTTIAPDSSRSVFRVQDRTIEAYEQTIIFDELGEQNQIKIINEVFNCKLENIKVINLIVVRSAAGSDKAWGINKKVRVLNYSMLAISLSKKLKSSKLDFINFDEEILDDQEELLKISNWKVENEKLIISDYEFEFPNISFDDFKIINHSLQRFKYYPNLERSIY